MKFKTAVFLLVSHVGVGFVGFAAGIYTLPILIEPAGPSSIQVQEAESAADFSAEFRRDLKGSDALHWGDGRIHLGQKMIVHTGELAPGPDYKLYLSPDFVETEEEFVQLKSRMVRVGDIKTFKGFVVDTPVGIDLEQYTSVVIWCETFGEFITAAKFR